VIHWCCVVAFVTFFQEYVPSCMLDVLHHGELQDADVVKYACQVARGVEYLHSQNVLHCDLAARNISYHSKCACVCVCFCLCVCVYWRCVGVVDCLVSGDKTNPRPRIFTACHGSYLSLGTRSSHNSLGPTAAFIFGMLSHFFFFFFFSCRHDTETATGGLP